jgi:drug/metabolite transporter (DMT)-like permease
MMVNDQESRPGGQLANPSYNVRQSSYTTPALAIAVIAVSFAAIFFRKAFPTHPIVCAGLRLAIAGLLLLPFTAKAATRGVLSAKFMRYAILAGLAYGIHFGSWVASLDMTSIAASVTLVTTTPLILAVVALLSGKGSPTLKLWICLALAFIGLALIGSQDFSQGRNALFGDVLAVIGAAAMAAYLMLGKRLGDDLDTLAFSGVATLVGAMSLLATAVALGIPLRPAGPEALFYLALAAIIPQLIGHNLLTWSLKYTTPVVVGIAILGEPVGATILGWIWLGEKVGPMVVAGCVLTLSSVALAIINRNQGKFSTP